MHVLIGSLVGAVCAVIWTTVFALATRRPLTTRQVLLAALGGAVGGAVTAATLGAAGLVGATTARQVVAFAAGGAAGASVEQVSENAAKGRPLTRGVAPAAAVGATTGVASLGVIRGMRHGMVLLRHGRLPGPTPRGLVGRFLTAPVPSTGAGFRRIVVDWPLGGDRGPRQRSQEGNGPRSPPPEDGALAAPQQPATEPGAQPAPARGFVDRLAF